MIWWPLRCVNLLKPLVFTLPGTMEFYEKNGCPGWTAIPVFMLELVCGGFLMAPLLSRWAAAALIPVTIDALMVHWPHGWMFDWQGGGWEYIAFLTAALLSICRARRWPVFAGHPHSARIRGIPPAETVTRR